jgi:hypothetical protein
MSIREMASDSRRTSTVISPEIFRDDTEKRTYMTLYAHRIDLDVLDVSIVKFKECIDPDYID